MRYYSRKRMTLALMALCALFSTRTVADAAELEKLRMQFGSLAVPAFAAPFVAKESGAYARAGLDVEVLTGRLSQDTVNAVLAGTTDIGFVLGVNQILTVDKGQKVVAVGNFYGRNAFGLIASKESGVKTLADLEGKRVLLPAASYEALLRALIADQGGNPEKVEYVTIPQPAAMLTAYAGKRGDAVVTVIPFARSGVEESRPSTYIPFANVGDPEPLYVFITRPDILEKKKDAIRKFLAVTYATMGQINTAPDTMVDAFVKSVPGAKPDRVVPDYQAWMEFQCAEGQSMIGAPSKESLEKALALYARVKLTNNPLKADDLMTNEFFEGPNPVSTAKCP
jgi:ABC-type nitrate/sulfonate/bicarbonate transport system substrate-binding protein